jgi:hypothetical protein
MSLGGGDGDSLLAPVASVESGIGAFCFLAVGLGVIDSALLRASGVCDAASSGDSAMDALRMADGLLATCCIVGDADRLSDIFLCCTGGGGDTVAACISVADAPSFVPDGVRVGTGCSGGIGGLSSACLTAFGRRRRCCTAEIDSYRATCFAFLLGCAWCDVGDAVAFSSPPSPSRRLVSGDDDISDDSPDDSLPATMRCVGLPVFCPGGGVSGDSGGGGAFACVAAVACFCGPRDMARSSTLSDGLLPGGRASSNSGGRFVVVLILPFFRSFFFFFLSVAVTSLSR